jgi:hypothetical protein
MRRQAGVGDLLRHTLDAEVVVLDVHRVRGEADERLGVMIDAGRLETAGFLAVDADADFIALGLDDERVPILRA